MTVARASIIRGPAVVGFNGAIFYSEGDIIATPNLDVFEIMTSMFGKVDERVADVLWDIEFTPCGEWENLSVLFPHTTPVIGSSIFTAADIPIYIYTLAGKKYTYKAGAITQMPSLTFSAVKPLLGPVKFSAIGADDEAWSETGHRLEIASEAFSDTSFGNSIPTQPYTVAWGAVSPWDSLETEEGVTIEFDLALQPAKIDSSGTVDMTLENVGIASKFVPVGPTEQNMVDLLLTQGAGAVRGMSLHDNSANLVISGTGVYFILYHAAPKSGPLRFGRTVYRGGEFGFVGTRGFTDGVADAMFYVGAAAPA